MTAKPTSGLRRMVIDYPVEVLRQPDETPEPPTKPATRTARSLMSKH